MLKLMITKKQIDIAGLKLVPRTEFIAQFSDREQLVNFVSNNLNTLLVFKDPALDDLYDESAVVAEGTTPLNKFMKPLYSEASLFVVDTAIDTKSLRLNQLERLTKEELLDLIKSQLS